MFADPEHSSEPSDNAQEYPAPVSPEAGHSAASGSTGPFANRRPVAARLILFAAVALFFVVALLLVIFNSPQPNLRNAPEILLAHNFPTNAPKLPELAPLKNELSAEDIAFGRQQVARMVADRPEMARAVYESDPIWQFCVRGFAGAAIGEPILWDSSLPLNEVYPAEHLGPSEGNKGYIRIRKVSDSGETRGQPLTCEELWSGVVFEIENIRSTRAEEELYRRALAGRLSREEWILESTKLEYGAIRRQADDYIRLWRPLAVERWLPNTPRLWGVGVPRTYEGWISLYRDPDSYPWDVYGKYYDQEIVPYLASIGRRPKGSR